MRPFLAAALLLVSTVLAAQDSTSTDATPDQPLVGTWVSTEPILENLKFSLTFLPSDYRIDCTLGQTLGTWYSSETQIYFTPTQVGISASKVGNVGSSDIWNYKFMGEDEFQLSSGPISVCLLRKK